MAFRGEKMGGGTFLGKNKLGVYLGKCFLWGKKVRTFFRSKTAEFYEQTFFSIFFDIYFWQNFGVAENIVGRDKKKNRSVSLPSRPCQPPFLNIFPKNSPNLFFFV